MAREGLRSGSVQLIMKGQDMNTIRRSRIPESLYFICGLIVFALGAYSHDWYAVGIMGCGILVYWLVQQWRMRAKIETETATLPYRARLKANGGSHTAAEWRLLCERCNWCCACCGRRRPLTKDHVIPVIQGGSDDISNLQPLCGSCNRAKHGMAMRYRRRRFSQPVATPSRDDLIVSIITAYKTQGASLNVSQEARQLGISRALWYKLRDEAIAQGRL